MMRLIIVSVLIVESPVVVLRLAILGGQLTLS